MDLSGFEIHDTLSPKIWDENNKLYDGIQARLVKIANDFYEGTNLLSPIKDITLTGSLANYNWSDHSDLDLHIITDLSSTGDNPEVVKRLVDSLKTIWNKKHNISIKDYDVEVYVQDINQPHHSGGTFSLLDDLWINVPTRDVQGFDPTVVEKKATSLMRQIDICSEILRNGQYEDAIELCELLKEKIRRMRKGGLDRAGEFSNENIAFKILRREGYLDKLHSINTEAYDKKMSMTEIFLGNR